MVLDSGLTVSVLGPAKSLICENTNRTMTINH